MVKASGGETRMFASADAEAMENVNVLLFIRDLSIGERVRIIWKGGDGKPLYVYEGKISGMCRQMNGKFMCYQRSTNEWVDGGGEVRLELNEFKYKEFGQDDSAFVSATSPKAEEQVQASNIYHIAKL